MMMGVVGGPGPVRATHTPGGINVAITSGTSITCTVMAIFAFDGIPPYTIAWTGASSDVTVNTSTSFNPTVFATGSDVEHEGTLVYVVSDAGSGKFTASVDYNIAQGTIP